jgi:hypothetical protein
VSNVLVHFLYEVKSKKVARRVGHDIYEEMLEICQTSFKKYLKDDYESVVFRGSVNDMEVMFYDVFTRIREINQGGANVYVAAPDIVCAAPFTIFGKYDVFRLFMRTASRKTFGFKVYMNDGPRYFPAGMPSSWWDLGDDIWHNRKLRRKIGWDFPQHVHNTMFYAQPQIQAMSKEELLLPQYGYQYPLGEKNGIPIERAKVIHFHASRGRAIDVMRRFRDDGYRIRSKA